MLTSNSFPLSHERFELQNLCTTLIDDDLSFVFLDSSTSGSGNSTLWRNTSLGSCE